MEVIHSRPLESSVLQERTRNMYLVRKVDEGVDL